MQKLCNARIALEKRAMRADSACVEVAQTFKVAAGKRPVVIDGATIIVPKELAAAVHIGIATMRTTH